MVAEALRAMLDQNALTSQEKRLVQLFVKLCESLEALCLPYGVLLGWMFQTGCSIDSFTWLNQKTGQLTQFALPTLEDGEARQEHLCRVCREGANKHVCIVLHHCFPLDTAHARRPRLQGC